MKAPMFLLTLLSETPHEENSSVFIYNIYTKPNPMKKLITTIKNILALAGAN